MLPAGADDRAIVNAIVGDGLNYGRKPKGLVTFHAYPEGARKAVEEHLVEGAAYAAAGGVVRIHFTVSPEHVAGFKELLAAKVPFTKSGSASVTRSRSRCRNLRPTPSP